ncbi:hypothetical protein NLG97_g2315 [Lecanicillium saksenae]|uniref:Uncharacterized protein n=1 Tax=Lecanicillium saksenae TaxID=468837 RepID=A0ACC1R5B1_9HYPO|nr:hypothetical protein NLG97_g2315 [Lecanicillium saksenae]
MHYTSGPKLDSILRKLWWRQAPAEWMCVGVGALDKDANGARPATHAAEEALSPNIALPMTRTSNFLGQHRHLQQFATITHTILNMQANKHRSPRRQRFLKSHRRAGEHDPTVQPMVPRARPSLSTDSVPTGSRQGPDALAINPAAQRQGLFRTMQQGWDQHRARVPSTDWAATPETERDNDKMDCLEEYVTAVDEVVAAMETDMAAMKTDTDAVKTDTDAVKTDVAAVKTNMDAVKMKLDVGLEKLGGLLQLLLNHRQLSGPFSDQLSGQLPDQLSGQQLPDPFPDQFPNQFPN